MTELERADARKQARRNYTIMAILAVVVTALICLALVAMVPS